jgi:hypothetical protein
MKINVNTSRNIDDVKRKLQTLSTKAPIKLNSKYFKKEAAVEDKL